MSLPLALSLVVAVTGMEQDPALASLMRESAGSEQRVVKLLAGSKMTANRRKKLLAGLCQVRGMRGRYRDAARACEAELRFDSSVRDSAKFWRSLASVAPPRASGSTLLPITIDNLGLSEVPSTIDGVAVKWGVDTGAEVSIMPASVAKRLQVRRVGGQIRMDTTTVPVNGTLGVIDEIRLGQATLRNLVVMVLPDAKFDVGPGLRLPPLLGLPMLQAFGRIAWLDGVKQFALGAAAPRASGGTGAQLYWHQDGIGLRFDAANGKFVAHLDTGANRLTLFPDALPLLADTERASIVSRETVTGGAGGILKQRQDHVARVTATIAGVPATFSAVAVERDMDKSGARLGMDYLAQLSVLALDFTTMRVLATAKSAAAPVDLSFLNGDWMLLDPTGRRVGTSHVATQLPVAVVHELRSDAQGTLPVWFVRTERTGGWSQLFPSPKGDLREFTPLSAPGEWPLLLGADTVLTDGRQARFRLTLTGESADASHRLLQMSTDGGQTWQVIFDYQYRRVVAPPAPGSRPSR